MTTVAGIPEARAQTVSIAIAPNLLTIAGSCRTAAIASFTASFDNN
jgi:hypothetical protein